MFSDYTDTSLFLHTHHRLAEEEQYLQLTAREIRRLGMLTFAFIRQASLDWTYMRIGHYGKSPSMIRTHTHIIEIAV